MESLYNEKQEMIYTRPTVDQCKQDRGAAQISGSSEFKSEEGRDDMSEQRKKEIIDKILLEEAAIKHLKTALPLLSDGTYHNYELYASFIGQQYNLGKETFDTDYRVLILDDIDIIGMAIYTHTESAELLLDNIIYSQMEQVLFNEAAVFKMRDYFCGTSVFEIRARSYHYGQTESYITSIFTLNQQQLVALT